jgi:hypothetical protein
MRITFLTVYLMAAVMALSVAPAAAQNSSPPTSYPLPPPEPVIITTPDGRDVPARFGTTDRATRCLQYGTSIGVPRDQMADYIRRCALQ